MCKIDSKYSKMKATQNLMDLMTFKQLALGWM